MLIGPAKTISSSVLQLFRAGQEYTVAEMLTLVRRHRQCSQRGIYKELRGLIDRGVIVRSGSRYSLSLTWVLTMLQTAEDMYATLVDQRLKLSYLPRKGERKSWRFNDLQHLDRFWLQMIFLLFEESESREMYAWVPYFWFDLIHYQKDLEAQEAMRVAGNKMFLILGDDSYLSRLPMKYWSKDIYEWSYAKSPFDHLDTTYYDVIDVLVMTIELTPRTTREIAALFTEVRGPRDLWQIRRFQEIKRGSRSKLTIERNEQKARRLRGKFADFFGIRARRSAGR